MTVHSHGKLMLALESARMRLSIAIALETKSMPRDRWLCCLDTADQIRRLIKKVRKADRNRLSGSQQWIKALDRLDCLPIPSQASRLCEILRDIVTELE